MKHCIALLCPKFRWNFSVPKELSTSFREQALFAGICPVDRSPLFSFAASHAAEKSRFAADLDPQKLLKKQIFSSNEGNKMNGLKYETVLFDLDGTLLNTLEDLCDALNYALVKNHFPARTKEEVQSFVGHGVSLLVRLGMGCNDASLSADPLLYNRVYGDFREFYDRHCCVKTSPYKGVLPMLFSLQKKGIKTAVFSNKPDERVRELCAHYFPGLFTACAGEKKGIPRKPSPEGIFSLLQTLKSPIETALYVGDSEVDVETAKEAGIDGVFVTWGFRSESELRLAGAKNLIHLPESLLSFPGIER